MATRKIKNAKDLVTDELIYFKSHAQATFMSDGTTVEDKINGLQNGGGVDLSKYVQKTELSSVATSGNYNDLSNKPTIPSAVTESTVSGWGFTKNTGTYSKPSGGIPKSDLSSVVQTSLGKADTALQSYTEQYKGTVTGVKINGTTKNPSSGIVDLGTVITAHQTLKTINGESIVGSGDIVISGGGSGDIEWVYAPGYHELDYWCVISNAAFPFELISPNKIYVVPDYAVGSLDLTDLEHVNDYGDEYRLIFKTHDTYPPSIYSSNSNYNFVYANGTAEVFKADTWYDVRLIRTVYEGTQRICVIATEFSNESSNGASGANVQAVDTGDVIDDVAVSYATKSYVDGLVGDINSTIGDINSILGNINSVLESIING